MMQFVNWRMRVTISDTRTLVGTFLAFDKHMNIVLGDTEEYRTTKAKKATGEKEEKRTLGLVLLRGETVVSLSAEAPPPPKPRSKQGAGRGGPGVGQAAGRGMPVTPLAQAPKGLTGPVRGLGGPGTQVMMPQLSAPPLSYGAPTPPRPQGQPQQQQQGGMFGGRGAPPPPMMMMPPVGFPGGPPPQFGGRGGPPQGLPGQGPPPFFPPPFPQPPRPQ